MSHRSKFTKTMFDLSINSIYNFDYSNFLLLIDTTYDYHLISTLFDQKKIIDKHVEKFKSNNNPKFKNHNDYLYDLATKKEEINLNSISNYYYFLLFKRLNLTFPYLDYSCRHPSKKREKNLNIILHNLRPKRFEDLDSILIDLDKIITYDPNLKIEEISKDIKVRIHDYKEKLEHCKKKGITQGEISFTPTNPNIQGALSQTTEGALTIVEPQEEQPLIQRIINYLRL